jgi:CarD family transcriptional regulator
MQARKEEGRSRKTTKATPRPGATRSAAARSGAAKPKTAKAESTSARVTAVKAVKAPAKAGAVKAAAKSTPKNGSNGHDAKKKIDPKDAKLAAAASKIADKAADKAGGKPAKAPKAEPRKAEPRMAEPAAVAADPTKDVAKSNSSFARPSPWSAPVLPPVKVDPSKVEIKVDTEGEFRVGETVVYPARGVADIVAVEDKDIGGRRQSFYVLRVHDTEQKILVPVNNAAQIGLRRPISEAQVREIFRILKVTDVPLDTQTWNRRYRGFVEKLATGSVFAVAEVLRDLSRVKIVKDGLSFSERQMREA